MSVNFEQFLTGFDNWGERALGIPLPRGREGTSGTLMPIVDSCYEEGDIWARRLDIVKTAIGDLASKVFFG